MSDYTNYYGTPPAVSSHRFPSLEEGVHPRSTLFSPSTLDGDQLDVAMRPVLVFDFGCGWGN